MPNSTQRVVIRRSRHTAQHFIEDLGNGVGLDMVLIPGGTFTMGSPDTELQRRDSEGPQHDIDVPRFLMGRYPVTQEQWREVAGYPKATNQLQPDPSKFKGSSRPVKRVSWDDAIEFCQRLSVRTGRTYRLPSEAEWEYACRA
ncbi:MAG: formylglycine-generating enzyme family protein, partial [Cyanobacteria bacterium P01_E01_bin.34]